MFHWLATPCDWPVWGWLVKEGPGSERWVWGVILFRRLFIGFRRARLSAENVRQGEKHATAPKSST